MPLKIEERDCQQSDGTDGSWAVVNEDTGEVESCHKTKQKASISAAFRKGEIDSDEQDD